MDSGKGGLALLQCYSDSDSESDGDSVRNVDSKKESTIIEDSSVGKNSTTNSTDPLAAIDEISPKDSETIDSQQDSTIKKEENCAVSSADCGNGNRSPSHSPMDNISKDNSRTSLMADSCDKTSRSLPVSFEVVNQENQSPNNVKTLLGGNANDSVVAEGGGTVNAPLSYRIQEEPDSDGDSSSDESILTASVVDVVDIADDAEDEDADDQAETMKVKKKSKMLEDLGIVDLPPIEDLTITVPQEECIVIGKISNIIDSLVIVVANKGTPAIDLDSVLFLDHGVKTLGKVFDVFGPVSEPMYMVRFNTAEDIADRDLKIGLDVYYAPRTQHTAFVFLDSLIKMKGSDASWEHDTEPPEGCIDYSDDEEERRAKALLRMKKSGNETNSDPNLQRKKRQKPNARQPRANFMPPNPFYMRPPPPAPVGAPYANYYAGSSSSSNSYPAPMWPPGPPPSSWAGRLPPPSWVVPQQQQSQQQQQPQPPYMYNPGYGYPSQFGPNHQQ